MTTDVLQEMTGLHAVQFYESERFLHRAIERFVAPGLRHGDPVVMIARARTFEAVADHLASGRDFSPLQTLDAERITFIDADVTIRTLMDGDLPSPARVAQAFGSLVSECRREIGPRHIRIYGEMVDVLCRDGRHAAAIRIEELWNQLSPGQDVSSLCGYALGSFDDDLDARHLRGVCGQHAHIVPAEEFSDPARERAWCEQVALLQHRTRVRDRVPESDPDGAAAAAAVTSVPTIYVVDDDASVRRALARLLALPAWPVRTYASGEAFLADIGPASTGCLILDIQLVGMSGIDVQLRLAEARWHLPVIAMSASQDARIEAEAMRLGARAFMRKPFDPQRLLDTVARVLRGHG
jgi:CheY-like chemotaxis protein